MPITGYNPPEDSELADADLYDLNEDERAAQQEDLFAGQGGDYESEPNFYQTPQEVEPIPAPMQTGRAMIAAPAEMEPAGALPISIKGPGGLPISAPSPTRYLSPEEAADREATRRLQYAVADQPYKDAIQAVEAAMKFQGIRGYQRDLANGMSAAEALAKWAPSMFATKGAASMSGAASLLRATGPGAERIMNVGGQAYRYDPITHTMTPLTRAKVGAPSQADLIDYRDVTHRLTRLQEKINDDPLSPAATEYRRQAVRLQNEKAQIEKRIRAPGAFGESTATGRIRVKHPGGKVGSIPASQLNAAIAAGYTQLR